MTADARRIVDDARAVFVRLDEDATRHLEQSWRGHAGGRALEALRRYISDALDGLAGRPSFPGISVPAAPALASPGTAAGTVPAGFGGGPAMPMTPMANNRNGFDDYQFATPTHAAASPPAPHLAAPSPRPMPDAESPPPAASLKTCDRACDAVAHACELVVGRPATCRVSVSAHDGRRISRRNRPRWRCDPPHPGLSHQHRQR